MKTLQLILTQLVGQNVVDMTYKQSTLVLLYLLRLRFQLIGPREDAPITFEGREALLTGSRHDSSLSYGGDALPVSAFGNHVDGQFEFGAAAYEKRGIAVVVPEWNVEKCIQ